MSIKMCVSFQSKCGGQMAQLSGPGQTIESDQWTQKWTSPVLNVMWPAASRQVNFKFN